MHAEGNHRSEQNGENASRSTQGRLLHVADSPFVPGINSLFRIDQPDEGRNHGDRDPGEVTPNQHGSENHKNKDAQGDLPQTLHLLEIRNRKTQSAGIDRFHELVYIIDRFMSARPDSAFIQCDGLQRETIDPVSKLQIEHVSKRYWRENLDREVVALVGRFRLGRRRRISRHRRPQRLRQNHPAQHRRRPSPLRRRHRQHRRQESRRDRASTAPSSSSIRACCPGAPSRATFATAWNSSGASIRRR